MTRSFIHNDKTVIFCANKHPLPIDTVPLRKTVEKKVVSFPISIILPLLADNKDDLPIRTPLLMTIEPPPPTLILVPFAICTPLEITNELFLQEILHLNTPDLSTISLDGLIIASDWQNRSAGFNLYGNAFKKKLNVLQ